jgi:hypothetical protein
MSRARVALDRGSRNPSFYLRRLFEQRKPPPVYPFAAQIHLKSSWTRNAYITPLVLRFVVDDVLDNKYFAISARDSLHRGLDSSSGRCGPLVHILYVPDKPNKIAHRHIGTLMKLPILSSPLLRTTKISMGMWIIRLGVECDSPDGGRTTGAACESDRDRNLCVVLLSKHSDGQ